MKLVCTLAVFAALSLSALGCASEAAEDDAEKQESREETKEDIRQVQQAVCAWTCSWKASTGWDCRYKTDSTNCSLSY